MISVAEWVPSYGDPHTEEESSDYAEVWEHPQCQAVQCSPEGRPALAFVDGVRRGEAWLYMEEGTALAAVYGCGATLSGGYTGIQCKRVFLRPAGCRLVLPQQPGGWSWQPLNLECDDLAEIVLQRRMRCAEAQLALELASQGTAVVLDGPLHGAALLGSGIPLVGYVKTQEKLLLAPEQSGSLSLIQPGQRSSVFRWGERHGCYVRMAQRNRHQHPYFGLIRLETVGEASWARDWLHQVAGWILAFAGVSHLDPRAPQNLQSIAGLERELRRRCGDSALALRAVRQAVAQLQKEERWNESA